MVRAGAGIDWLAELDFMFVSLRGLSRLLLVAIIYPINSLDLYLFVSVEVMSECHN